MKQAADTFTPDMYDTNDTNDTNDTPARDSLTTQPEDTTMFDINATINAAITAAVNARVAEVLQQQYTNMLGALAERLAELEIGALAERVAALENNPAMGTDTLLAARVTELEGAVYILMGNPTADTLLKKAIDDHLEMYDHDSYDDVVSTVEDHDLDDFVTKYDVQDIVTDGVVNAVNESLSNAEVTIRVR